MSGSVRTLARQTVIYGLSSIVPRFLNFLLVPLYTYFFKPADYGIVADLYSWAVLLNIVVTYGMETAVFRFTKNDSSGVSAFATAFYSILISSLLFFFAVALNAAYISDILGYPGRDRYVIYFAFIIAIDAVSAILFVKLRVDEKALRFSIVKIHNVALNVLLNLCFIVLFPWFFKRLGQNFTLTVDYIFIANLFASAFTFLLLVDLIPSPGVAQFRLWKSMLVYGIPLMLSGIVGAINDVIDRQFIKYFSPKSVVNPLADLGVYFANLKIAVILVLFVQAFRYAAEPFFFKNADEKGGRESFARVAVLYVSVSMLVFLFTYANLPVFKYFIGSAYWSGLFIVPVVLLANVFAGLYLNFSMWYKLADKTFMGFLIILIGCLFTVVLDYFFVPIYGYPAAAVIRMFSYILITVICYVLGQRYYPIPYRIDAIVLYFAVALVLFVGQFFVTKFLSGGWVMLINNILFLIFVFYFIKKENLTVVINQLLWSIKSRLRL